MRLKARLRHGLTVTKSNIILHGTVSGCVLQSGCIGRYQCLFFLFSLLVVTNVFFSFFLYWSLPMSSFFSLLVVTNVFFFFFFFLLLYTSVSIQQNDRHTKLLLLFCFVFSFFLLSFCCCWGVVGWGAGGGGVMHFFLLLPCVMPGTASKLHHKAIECFLS